MNYIYSYPAKLVFDEENPKPGDLVFDHEQGGLFYYLSGSERGDGTLVGSWEGDGTLVVNNSFQTVRPFGNSVEEGAATDSLDYLHWMGDAQRQMQAAPAPETAPQYPADNQPFVITMRRVWREGPPKSGWGWIASIQFVDPNRAPRARKIDIHNEDWGNKYSSGAFNWTDTGEVDDEGQPIYEWQTTNPPSKVTDEKEDIYYSLKHQSTQEGKMVIPTGIDSRQNFFWGVNQN